MRFSAVGHIPKNERTETLEFVGRLSARRAHWTLQRCSHTSAIFFVSGGVPDATPKPLQISVYDAAGNVIEARERTGDFNEWEVYFVADRLESSSALNQIYDEDDESNHEQKMDQAAANVAEQPKKPEH